MVGSRIHGKISITDSSPSRETFNSTMARLRASRTDLKLRIRASMAVFLSGESIALGLAYNRVVDRKSSSTTTSALAARVSPVAVISTITSASSGGRTSVAP